MTFAETPSGIAPLEHTAATADVYHADQFGDTPTLSASIAKLLCTASPAHAYANHPRLNPDYQRKDEDRFDLGTVAHSLILEGIENVDVVHEDSWRSKNAQEIRDQARQYGRVALLAKDWDRVRQMIAAADEQLDRFGLTPRPFTGGKPEVALMWEQDGVRCRALIDWLHDDATVIDDLKTTSASAHPQAWSKTAHGIGCDIQVAHYLAAVEAVYGVRPDFRYIVIETAPPYALTVMRPSSETVALGQSKLEHALAVWKECLATGVWPGYPAEVATLESPAWATGQWMERELAGEVV